MGNGILTVENDEQAWSGAGRRGQQGGGAPTRFAMIALRAKLGL
jgi:6,7-dimethyl-8-ribityllumazine synthase